MRYTITDLKPTTESPDYTAILVAENGNNIPVQIVKNQCDPKRWNILVNKPPHRILDFQFLIDTKESVTTGDQIFVTNAIGIFEK